MEYNPDTPEGIELLGKQRPNSMALVDEFMKDFEGDPLTIDEQAAAIAVASKMQGSFCFVPSFHFISFLHSLSRLFIHIQPSSLTHQ